jgi:D-xylose transport system permease protein
LSELVSKPAEDSPSAPQGFAAGLSSRLAQGDLGFIPVIVALIGIAIVFYLGNPLFLTPRNLSNLSLQVGVLGVMTLGMTLVLLIGEIDLSAGSLSGMTAVVMVLLSSKHDQPAYVAITAAIALGAFVGFIQGLCVVTVRAPSFIVTLTGLLVWQGVQHMLIGYEIGQIEVDDPFITGIASTYMPAWLSILIVAALTAAAAAYCIRNWSRAEAQASGRAALVLRAFIYPAVAAAATLILSRYFGVPYLLLLLVTLAAILTIVTEQTPLGVHIFSVGGNPEAARRAGVNIDALRVFIFMICSAFAALAGIIAASRQYAVDSNTGGGNQVLDAIAASVIGGTSLFGGRGRIVGALLGALVIAAVANGLDLLGQSVDVKTIITGLILLAAVTVDMIARRRRISSGAAGA